MEKRSLIVHGKKVNNDESIWVLAWWVVLVVLKLDYFGLEFSFF
jgi:hypothetical protein